MFYNLLTSFAIATVISVCGLMTAPADALDLGVQGQLYTIQEIDMREAIIRSADDEKVKQLQAEQQASAKTFFEQLPDYGLPHATETITRWVDPSIVLTQDIQVPQKGADGEYTWQILYRKGTRVNPLATVTPVDRMLFFDGSDPDQVQFALDVLKAHPIDVLPVEVAGNPKVLSEKISRPVFYANEGMLSRFGIRESPSLLGVGQGAHAHRLAVTGFAPQDYTVNAINAAWYGIEVGNKKGGNQQ